MSADKTEQTRPRVKTSAPTGKERKVAKRAQAMSVKRFGEMVQAAGFAPVHPLDGPASKDEAVKKAVTIALSNAQVPLDDLSITMKGPPKHFTRDSFAPVLKDIQKILAGTRPPLRFSYDKTFFKDALAATPGGLMHLVYTHTTP